MSEFNQDLQASHILLGMMELAMVRTDSILDDLSDVFTIVDEDFTILRGNKELGKLFEVEREMLLGVDFKSLFRKQTWDTFELRRRKIEGKSSGVIEFELDVDAKSIKKDRKFHWSLKNFGIPGTKSEKTYAILGRDVSALRETEKQLATVFKNAPLAILFIDENGLIDTLYSAHSELIFLTNTISKQHINKVLFNYCYPQMTVQEKINIDQFFSSLGKSSSFFETIRDSLPRLLHFISPEKLNFERFLSINYHPIVFNQTVTKTLLIIEDRSEVVQMQRAGQAARIEEEAVLERYLQIKNGSDDLLPIIFSETSSLVSKLEKALSVQDHIVFISLLHSIKGSARVAGFKQLSRIVHDGESRYSGGREDWGNSKLLLGQIQIEWNELKCIFEIINKDNKKDAKDSGGIEQNLDFFKEMFKKFQNLVSQGTLEKELTAERVNWALQTIHLVKLQTLEQYARATVEQTAKQLGKSVTIDFQWNETKVDEAIKVVISEALLHLLTNSVTHGLEFGPARIQFGKPEVGKIFISASEASGSIKVQVDDDGEGVNVEKIKNRALKNKLLTLDETLRLSEQEALELIFRPGFSTTEVLSEVSGRGVGLNAVTTSVNKMGGSVEVMRREPFGTRFQLLIPSLKSETVRKSCRSLREFLIVLEMQIKETILSHNCSLELPEDGFCSDSNGVIYADFNRLIISIIVYLGYFSAPGKLKVQIKKNTGTLMLEATRNRSTALWEEDPEFSMALGTSSSCLSKHQGFAKSNAESMEIQFGEVIGREKLPIIFLEVRESEGGESLKAKMEEILNISKELDIPMTTERSECSNLERQTYLVLTDKLNSGESGFEASFERKQIEAQLLGLIEKLLGVS